MKPLFLLSWASWASLTSAHAVVRQAAQGTVNINAFNYTDLGGPLLWYGLNETTNYECSKGSHQSPINIVTAEIGYAPAGSLQFEVPTVSGAKFENLKTGLEVVMPNGSLTSDGKTFPLAQFHFHTPGEHRINEEYFPMECHFVFETSAGGIAVVGFVIEVTSDSTTPLFADVFAHLSDVAEPGTYTTTGKLDFSSVIEHFNKYSIYAYTGSLTTPPCSENVLWYISEEPLVVNVEQYNAVKKVLKYNARYTQNALGQPNLLEVAEQELLS